MNTERTCKGEIKHVTAENGVKTTRWDYIYSDGTIETVTKREGLDHDTRHMG